MARMDGTINQPEDASQRRQNAAYAHTLRYARERYTPEAHIVELVDKTRAADNDAERQAPRASIWHALIALDDGRHAVVGARIAAPTDADHDAKRDEHDGWSVFEVSPPTLSDPRGV